MPYSVFYSIPEFLDRGYSQTVSLNPYHHLSGILFYMGVALSCGHTVVDPGNLEVEDILQEIQKREVS